ncbi:hypothetical protein RRG08_053671 [Elysia crispata]|uniref:EGF-like domain-containing protein n=1 Tax=Elysia crispata TaxID=231223 RepID=A0AAE0ZQ18_9GAST|nr:hypothetical protein RRG08_053671 [Elysia crispata]
MRNQNLIHGVACMAWKNPGLALALAVLYCESTIRPACSQQLVFNLSHKQFFISKNKFQHRSPSNFTEACGSSGFDVGVIDTNSEYSLLQASLFSLFQDEEYDLWLYINQTLNEGESYTYWWSDEEVNSVWWWRREPNLSGHTPESVDPSLCLLQSLICRPTQIVFRYDECPDGPLLRDNCCYWEVKGICMQDVNECLTPSSYNCTANSVCVNLPYSYTCQCLAGFEKINDECHDIDECLDSSPCPDNTVCTNTAGGFTCSTSQGTGLKLCSCQCPNFLKNMSLPLEESAKDIRNRLIVDTSNLSSKVRRLSSAEDRRASSVSMGMAAAALIVLALTVFTLPDVISACLWLWRQRKIRSNLLKLTSTFRHQISSDEGKIVNLVTH